MDPKQQVQKAIEHLEHDTAEANKAFKLLSAPPVSLRPALESFLNGLSSENGDVQIASALALGKLGHGDPKTLQALVEAYEHQGSTEALKNAIAFSIGALESIDAAEKLVRLIKQDFKSLEAQTLGEPSFLAISSSSCLSALAKMGGLAIEHRNIFRELLSKYSDTEMLFIEIENAYREFVSQIKEDHFHYLQHRPKDSPAHTKPLELSTLDALEVIKSYSGSDLVI